MIFIQEPAWQTIRQAPSTTNVDGDDVTGEPRHPVWVSMVRPPDDDGPPQVMAYVTSQLATLRPSMHCDLIDHRNLLLLSLFTEGRTINLLNVYNDENQTAVHFKVFTVPHRFQPDLIGFSSDPVRL